jgi:hypothetical protein
MRVTAASRAKSASTYTEVFGISCHIPRVESRPPSVCQSAHDAFTMNPLQVENLQPESAKLFHEAFNVCAGMAQLGKVLQCRIIAHSFEDHFTAYLIPAVQ